LKFASSAGIAGILCCVAPAVLFMFGLMGGAYAISFADFFYNSDGSVGVGGWVLRGFAIAIGAFGIYRFKTKKKESNFSRYYNYRFRTGYFFISGKMVLLVF
jgi:hypothetical protein